ncbi:hypothetical protein P0F38_003017 [Vibrio metschnikovii]|nr:hypothetical protein [Vibrio metschnikovii]
MSIINYDETTNTFSVYGQTLSADYFNHVQVGILLDIGWSVSLIHDSLKGTPLANHRDHRLINHRIELAEIAEKEAKEQAERERLAKLRDPAYQAELKRQHEAFAAQSRAHAAALKAGRGVRSPYDRDPVPSIKW